MERLRNVRVCRDTVQVRFAPADLQSPLLLQDRLERLFGECLYGHVLRGLRTENVLQELDRGLVQFAHPSDYAYPVSATEAEELLHFPGDPRLVDLPLVDSQDLDLVLPRIDLYMTI